MRAGGSGEARQIGEIIAPILGRIEAMYRLQRLLEMAPEPTRQKVADVDGEEA